MSWKWKEYNMTGCLPMLLLFIGIVVLMLLLQIFVIK
jgi:hypothetical protein